MAKTILVSFFFCILIRFNLCVFGSSLTTVVTFMLVVIQVSLISSKVPFPVSGLGEVADGTRQETHFQRASPAQTAFHFPAVNS